MNYSSSTGLCLSQKSKPSSPRAARVSANRPCSSSPPCCPMEYPGRLTTRPSLPFSEPRHIPTPSVMAPSRQASAFLPQELSAARRRPRAHSISLFKSQIPQARRHSETIQLLSLPARPHHPGWSDGIRATAMQLIFRAATTAVCKAARRLRLARSEKPLA